ncbi:MAG: NUDIX domain-containing protein [Nanoarchaeota archaeon]|nr:NUDIX domain-containing protein [Nanoarchaeota archaeon]MBU4086607.1 NUDIX domain-containing protein [Nanoarchaeota archaeon]
MKQEKSAGAVIYYADSGKVHFLLLKYPTYWGFAKGWVEESESEEQAAIREIREETGLNAELISGFRHEQRWFFRHEGNLINKHAIFFLVRVSKEDAEKVKISNEHEDFAWLCYEEAIKKMRVKQNKEMLASALEFIREIEKQKKLF